MRIIKPSVEILAMTPSPLQLIELAYRNCYKSEDKTDPEKTGEFLRKYVGKKHETPTEHASVTVRFIIDRGVSHELVRHRLASFSQSSTRYCNFSHEKFGKEITVIEPCFFEQGSLAYDIWKTEMLSAESAYFRLLKNGATPEQARSVLPNSLKTDIVMTANIREFRHILKLRCSNASHPQMREVMLPLLDKFNEILPDLFFDIAEGLNK